MDEKTFNMRTKKLAVAIIKEVDKLPRSRATDVIGKQLLRSGASIGANYRSACRAKSTPDMINKMKIVEEEADETEYWLEIPVEAGLTPHEQINNIYKETDENLATTVASLKTLRNRQPTINNRKSKTLAPGAHLPWVQVPGSAGVVNPKS